MSESTAGNPAATETANAAGGEATVTETDQAAGVSEVNARLLEESKANKKLAKDLKAQLDALNKRQLTEKEDYKKLWEDSESKRKALHTTVVTKSVKEAVSEKASKAGAIDLDAIMMLGDRSLLVVDEDSLAVDGVDAYLEDLRKKKPALFTVTKSAAVNGVTPGGVTKSNQKPLKDMTKDEILAQLRTMS